MWGLVKSIVFLTAMAFGLYGVFFVPLGGATLADHAREVWSSTIVQRKVKLVREGVEDELATKLERALANRAGEKPVQPEISDSDRAELEELLKSPD